jgi:uncharacterized membrane protein (UPF0127 family)
LRRRVALDCERYDTGGPMETVEVKRPANLRAINQTRATVLCERLEKAGGMAGKSRGLLGRDGLEADAGMLFEAGRLEPFMCMHMWFMRFSIDIVFLNRQGRVIRINHNLRPWRISSIVWGARRVLELPAGAAAYSQTSVGDQIIIDRPPATSSSAP